MSGSIMTNLIVTISDYANYGNRLQNYALQTILDDYGETTTVYDRTNTTSTQKVLKEDLRKSLFVVKAHILRRQHLLELKRVKKCIAFTERYVPDDKFRMDDYQGFKAHGNATFNRVIVGSDQVWNPQWITARDLELRLASFAPADCPVISYAASFGVSAIEDNSKLIFQKYLPNFKSISVREFRGAELVQEITGLSATVVLDPTLMLSAESWECIIGHFVPDDDCYVLTYFLGRPSDAQEKNIQDYAKEHGCRVRRILDNRDPETYVAGPQDFVELFSKADYVFTDSYHACCFSLLFHKQFTVFNRAEMTGKANMNSRMETLFRLFNLDSVMMDEGLAPLIDYKEIDVLLETHRVNSRHWLDDAMHVN